MWVTFKSIAKKDSGDVAAIPKHYTLVGNKNIKQATTTKGVTSLFIKQTKIYDPLNTASNTVFQFRKKEYIHT